MRKLRRAYSFDEMAIVPGNTTINPEIVNTSFSIGNIDLGIPILGAAMDSVASPNSIARMYELGGMTVLNLEGLYTRYYDSDETLKKIIEAYRVDVDVTSFLQKVYSQPILPELVRDLIGEIKNRGAKCAVSMTPPNAKRLAPIAVEAGADVIVIQSTVTTAKHISNSLEGLDFSELVSEVGVPVIVGNCVSTRAAYELMRTGIHGILVGVGPGAVCTTREVTGVGVPQITATMDCVEARERFYDDTGRYVPIITDGGIRTGGDLCKALVAGADAVMLGTPLAQAREAPGGGYHWGMANPHPELPRGTMVNVGIKGTLERILFGPTSKTDGTQNLIGALKVCMSMLGAGTIKEMHDAELVIAPAIKTEGKIYQLMNS